MSNKTLFTITSSRSKVFVTFSYSLFPKCVRTSIFRCRTWTQSSLSAATSLPTCSPMRTTSTSWVTHCFRPLQTINLSHFQIAGKLVFIFPSKQQKKNLDLYVVSCNIVFNFSQRCKFSWFHSTKLRSSATKSWRLYGHSWTASRYNLLR